MTIRGNGENRCRFSLKTANHYRICHPERNKVKSRDLRIIVSAEQMFGAKILRFPSVTQDDNIFV